MYDKKSRDRVITIVILPKLSNTTLPTPPQSSYEHCCEFRQQFEVIGELAKCTLYTATPRQSIGRPKTTPPQPHTPTLKNHRVGVAFPQERELLPFVRPFGAGYVFYHFDYFGNVYI